MHEDTVPEGNEDPGAEYADGDYGYDLAHEAMSDASTTAPAAGKPEPPHFEPAPDDSDGDYGYDLAHDMRTT
jgi:hypothetical protein